ncbi:MAG: YihY/virulence factor BrkB family protein [Deltaproteobacteria bacterium]|nr:YihY/virulence factor BrkB family protein [Deltaproteobacteria bacterium]MBN2674582.1 YihY/virulence factor BrkB family protein [Deltaproteobacteria bacterium]
MRYPFFKYITDVTRATIFPADLANSKREFILIYAVRLFFLVGQRLWHDKCLRQAAALAYQTFLSLVPLMFLGLAATTFFKFDFHIEEVIHFFESYLVPDAAAKVAQYIRDTVASIRPGALGILGGTTFLMVALTLFFTVEQIVNEIFRCKRGRKLYIRALLSIFLIITVPAAFGISLYYSGKLLFFVPDTVQTVLPAVVTITSLFFGYWLLPHRKTQKRHAVTSSIVAGVALELVKWGFALYATYLGDTLSYVYGTMAILPMFLVWIYLTWLIFLFGAELNAALHEVKHYSRFDG